MSTVSCGRCRRILEFSGARPSFCAYCGQPLSSEGLDVTVDHASSNDRSGLEGGGPEHEPIPAAIAGLRIIRKIGDGGMGTVYEAEDAAHGRRVAVKVLSNRYDAGEDSIERFRQEGRLASTISHPRCVFVLGADEAEGRPYIVMELMTGSTLQSLVEQSGPMEVESAVARILDVIDGLIEAHRLGVVHRDVKPSNCFLEADGRVKVGDFGLSKSLASNAHLTRDGAFIGTPLYASPEQIKSEGVDRRTDIYSVSATLYFLLAGRPPFQAKDAAAALARIVSESPMSLREYEPGVPSELESVILRGMDRDRERRYHDLEELSEALSPFAPRAVRSAPPAFRAAAFAMDLGLFVLGIGIVAGLRDVVVRPVATASALGVDALLLIVYAAMWLCYFGVGDGWFGRTIGKYAFGVRTTGMEAKRPPGVGRGALRAAVLGAVVFIPTLVAMVIVDRVNSGLGEQWVRGLAIGVLALSGMVVGSPMRRSSGYRGLHERVSGTRVVSLPRRARRRAGLGRRAIGRDREVIRRPVGVLERVGPYKIRGAVRWESDRRVLSAQDRVLGREVWVVLRARGEEPISTARRELARPTRPRWLSGGSQAEGRWDAYVAPAGALLSDLAGPTGLDWEETRPLLADLAAELAAACDDGTLPTGLHPDQVWVEPDGRLQLVDSLGSTSAKSQGGFASNSDHARALVLFRSVAALALEGGRRRSGDTTTPIRAAVPLGARLILDRLDDADHPFATTTELCAAMQAEAERPTQIGPITRLVRLGGFVASVALRYFACLIVVDEAERWGVFTRRPVVMGLDSGDLALAASLLVWVAAAAITRGRVVGQWLGFILVDEDGRVPGRWRAAFRELLIWLPLAAGMVALRLILERRGALPALSYALCAWPIVLPAVYAAFGVFDPDRALHDRLSGTRVLPR